MVKVVVRVEVKVGGRGDAVVCVWAIANCGTAWVRGRYANRVPLPVKVNNVVGTFMQQAGDCYCSQLIKKLETRGGERDVESAVVIRCYGERVVERVEVVLKKEDCKDKSQSRRYLACTGLR